MKIVHVVPYFHPQLGYEEYYLAKGQQALGHEVTIVASDRYAPWAGVWKEGRIVGPKSSIEEGVKVHRLPCRLEFGSNVVAGAMRRTLSALRPDIVHAHDVHSVITAQPALHKWEIGYRYVLDSHTSVNVPYLYRNVKGRILYLALKRVLYIYAVAQSDKLVGTYPAAKRWISIEYSIPENKISLVSKGVDTSLFRPDATARKKMRMQLGVGENDLLILHVGRLDPRDRIDDLIRAVSRLKYTGGKVLLLLVGGGGDAYSQRLQAMVRDAGNVSLTLYGLVHRSNMNTIYNSADIAVWLTRHPVSILEAIACGVPVVVTRNWPIGDHPLVETAQEREFLLYDNGMAFDEGDIDGLAECLSLLASDRQLRNDMGTRGRRLAEERFDWTVQVNKWISLYKDALQATPEE